MLLRKMKTLCTNMGAVAQVRVGLVGIAMLILILDLYNVLCTIMYIAYYVDVGRVGFIVPLIQILLYHVLRRCGMVEP